MQTSLPMSLSNERIILWSGFDFNNHSSKPLHFILNDSRKPFSQLRGIILFKTDSLFTNILRPTFLQLVLRIEKVDCCEVKVWFVFNLIHSIEGDVVLYNLNNWIANLYCINESGRAFLFVTCILMKEIIGSG